MIHGFLPVLGGAPPVGGNVAQGEPDQLGRSVPAREMPSRRDDLAQPRIDTLDGVGGVDHPSDWGGKRKERDHLVSGPAPGSRNRRKLHAPQPLGEGAQFRQRRFSARLGVGGPDRRLQRFGMPFKPVGDDN